MLRQFHDGATRNTRESGVLHFLIYKDGKRYTGVCLELDIVEQGDSPVDVRRSLEDAAKAHVETVVRKKLDDKLLNRYAPASEWKRLSNILNKHARYLRLLQSETPLQRTKRQTFPQNIDIGRIHHEDSLSDLFVRTTDELVRA